MQVIVTSYMRLAYLRRTVASLRQDPVELYVVDGGSDEETVRYIRSAADGWLLFKGNPGADFLKTEGIKRFATEREFVVTSDDLVFPKGYSLAILRNYLMINPWYPDRIDWTFCACQMPHMRIRQWARVKGVWCRPAAVSQVAGAVIDTRICREVGYFPNYGRTGQGDFAFNKRLEALGVRRCYWQDPEILHIGGNKPADYPELHELYMRDKAEHMPHGRADDGLVIDPGPQSPEAGFR